MMIMWNMTTAPWLHFFFSLAGVFVVPLLDPSATPVQSTWSYRKGNTRVGPLEPAWAWKPVWSSLHLWQSSFGAVLVVEDSSPTCPAELSKGLLAFIRVLAANSVLCLFIGRWHGGSPKEVCEGLDITAQLRGLCDASPATGRVGLRLADACDLPAFSWRWLAYGRKVCLPWDISVVAKRSICGHLTPSWLEGREL